MITSGKQVQEGRWHETERRWHPDLGNSDVPVRCAGASCPWRKENERNQKLIPYDSHKKKKSLARPFVELIPGTPGIQEIELCYVKGVRHGQWNDEVNFSVRFLQHCTPFVALPMGWCSAQPAKSPAQPIPFHSIPFQPIPECHISHSQNSHDQSRNRNA